MCFEASGLGWRGCDAATGATTFGGARRSGVMLGGRRGPIPVAKTSSNRLCYSRIYLKLARRGSVTGEPGVANPRQNKMQRPRYVRPALPEFP